MPQEHSRSLQPLCAGGRWMRCAPAPLPLRGAAGAAGTGCWEGVGGCIARPGHSTRLSSRRDSRNPWKGAGEWSSVPSVWSWLGMPGICVWQCFWGKQIVFMSERKDHVSGQSLQLVRSNPRPQPHMPRQVASAPSMLAARASPQGGQAAGGAPLGRVMVNLHSPKSKAR